MRIFQCYTFDIKKRAVFSQTMDYIEQFFDDNKIFYQTILFQIEKVGEELESLFPDWKRFRLKGQETKRYSYSNLTDTLNIYDYVEKEKIRHLIHQIPNLIHPSFCVFALDGVDWFKEGTKDAFIQDTMVLSKQNPIVKFPDSYFSDQVIFSNSYLQRQKWNYIRIKIDITDKKTEGVRDFEELKKKLADYFGEPVREEKICLFEEKEEREKLYWKKKQLEKYLSQIELCILPPLIPSVLRLSYLGKDTQMGVMPLQLPHYLIRYQDMESQDPISIKRAIKKNLLQSGYQYASGKNHIHRLRKKTKNGHWFTVEFSQSDIRKRKITGFFIMEGYNFYEIIRFNSHYIKCQEELVLLMENYSVVFRYLENMLENYLLEQFGTNPDWYEPEEDQIE